MLRDDADKWRWLMSSLPQLLADAAAAGAASAEAASAAAALSGSTVSGADTGGALLVFVSTKTGCNTLNEALAKAGYLADCIHGDKSQYERADTLRRFKKGETNILLATDVAGKNAFPPPPPNPPFRAVP